MKLLFTGTGGSTGIPMVGCSCAVCKSTNSKNRRRRTAAIIKHENRIYAIDAGPDFHAQMLKYHVQKLHAILLTHTHYDHVGGLPDVRPYTFSQEKKMAILVSRTTRDAVEKYYHFATDRFTFQILEKPFEDVTFEGLPLSTVTYEQLGMPVTGFRFGNSAYITDIRSYTKKLEEHLQNLDTLILSALRPEPTEYQFGLDEAVSFAKKVGAKKTYFTHIAHDLEHEKTNEKLPENISLAYDGLEITL